MRQLLPVALSSALVLQLAPLMAAPAAIKVRPGGVAPATTRVIQGTLQNAAGQTLPSYRVQVRDLHSGRVTAITTSNAEGAFSFAGLPPASYVVEVVRTTGEIVGVNGTATALGNGISKTTVTVAGATAAADSGAPTGTAALVARAAASAGIAGRVVTASRYNASPSR